MLINIKIMTYYACIPDGLVAYCTSQHGGAICRDKARIPLFSLQKSECRWKREPANIRHRISRSCGPRLSSLPPKGLKTNRSASSCLCRVRSYPDGESASSKNASLASTSGRGAGDRASFPPQVVVAVKALACELPKEWDLPFSRLSHADIAAEAVNRGIVGSISDVTVWRWLSADAIRPWCHRSWIFPRDPNFAARAAPVLDLYHGVWEGKPLGPDDYVISSDEKTSIQARKRIAPGTPPTPGRRRKVEAEYERMGALAYLAAWDVHRAKVFGICAPSSGIDPFHRVVDLVMSQEPYRSAHRVFWVTDNGSSHRGESSVRRLKDWYPNAIQVHTPVHASWLNQIEIYFSVVQRKVLTPNEFNSLAEVEDRLMAFQVYYEKAANPFEWKFTNADLRRLLSRLDNEQIKELKAA